MIEGERRLTNKSFGDVYKRQELYGRPEATFSHQQENPSVNNHYYARNDITKMPISTRSERHNMAQMIVKDCSKPQELRTKSPSGTSLHFVNKDVRPSDQASILYQPLKKWELGKVKNVLESHYAREKIDEGDPNYQREMHKRYPESSYYRGTSTEMMIGRLNEKSEKNFSDPRNGSADPTILSRHSRITRGSS